MTSLTRTKREILFPHKLLKSLTLLASLVLVRGPYVKPRDARRLLGISDLGALTWLGRVLNLLTREGLAVRFNSGRPRRYRLKEWVAARVATYGFRCFRGLQCPHLPTCPIRKALKGMVRYEG